MHNTPPPPPPPPPPHPTTETHPIWLQATDLTKRFGGLAAVQGVNLQLWKGRIHAVIGPNGAGKSTLTNLLSGDLAPTTGHIDLMGKTLSGRKPHQISQWGLGRSYQKTNLFFPLTVWDNVCLAAQSRAKHRPYQPWHWLQSATKQSLVHTAAEQAIEKAGLQARTHTIAATMSHGEQRQLEIAMTLATAPNVLLLDEPLAGMGVMEAERMVTLLHQLKQDHAILLVEHDMDAVFSLADHLTVMVNGQIIASGSPDEIRNNANVQAAYLGEEHL